MGGRPSSDESAPAWRFSAATALLAVPVIEPSLATVLESRLKLGSRKAAEPRLNDAEGRPLRKLTSLSLALLVVVPGLAVVWWVLKRSASPTERSRLASSSLGAALMLPTRVTGSAMGIATGVPARDWK